MAYQSTSASHPEELVQSRYFTRYSAREMIQRPPRSVLQLAGAFGQAGRHPVAKLRARLGQAHPVQIAHEIRPRCGARAARSLTAEGEIPPIIQVEFLEFERGTGEKGASRAALYLFGVPVSESVHPTCPPDYPLETGIARCTLVTAYEHIPLHLQRSSNGLLSASPITSWTRTDSLVVRVSSAPALMALLAAGPSVPLCSADEPIPIGQRHDIHFEGLEDALRAGIGEPGGNRKPASGRTRTGGGVKGGLCHNKGDQVIDNLLLTHR